MSSTGTEHYSRIMLTLMKGGTKLTRRLVEKRVKDLSKNGEEDTIDEFLLKNKSLILKQKLGKNKQDVFFPQFGQTNLDNWDLCMFCLILEETCDLTHITKMYIKKLLKIRNKLCHLNDPTLETRKFEEYTEQMKCSFEYCLKEINDDMFTEEMNALVQSLATGPLSIDDTLKAVHKLYRLEWTHREVLEKIGNGQDLTNGKLDTLIEKVEILDSRWQSGASVDIPGIGLVIEVKNCSAEKKKEVLDILEKNFNEAIEQKVSSLEEGLPNGVLHTLRETVAQVFQEFFIMGRHIAFVEQKCLMLTIKCTSVKSFVKMIRDYRTGDLSLQLSAIETAIKNLQGCGNVQLENLIFKEEFMEVMDDLVSKLYERVQQTEYTTVQTSSNADNSIRVTSKIPTLSERETVQNRFETKMFGKGMKRIESELRRKLNVESMSLTAILVKDDAVSKFTQQRDTSVVDGNATVEDETKRISVEALQHSKAQQSDTSVMDGNTTVEEETETRQQRRKAALSEEEDTSNPSLRRDSQLNSDESTLIFQGPVVTTTGKATQTSFHEGDMQIIKALEDIVPHVAKERGDNRLRTERQQMLVTEPSSATNMSYIPFFISEQRSISDEVGSGEILHYPTEESAYLSVDGVTTSVSIPDNRHSNMPLPHESQEAINQQDDVAQLFQLLNLDTVDEAPNMNRSEMIVDVDLSIDTSPAETDNPRPETNGVDASPNISGNTEVKNDSAPFFDVTPAYDETDLKITFANEDIPRLPDQYRLKLITTKNSLDSGYTTPSKYISSPICPNIENPPKIQTDYQKIKPQDNSSTTDSVKVKLPLVQSSTSVFIRPSAASLPMLDVKKSRNALSKIGAFLSLAMESISNSDVAFK